LFNKIKIFKIWFYKWRIRSLYKNRFYNPKKQQRVSGQFIRAYESDKEIILYFYKYISLLSSETLELPFCAKWLVENKAFLVGELHQLPELINKKLLDSLPVSGEMNSSSPIIFQHIKTFLANNKGWFSSIKLTDHLQKAQSNRDYYLDEIFSLQLLLKLLFISEIAKSAYHIFEFINANIDLKKQQFTFENPPSLEYLYYLLNHLNKKNFSTFGISNELIAESKKVIKGEKLGQSIINLKKLNETDWDSIFREISKVDKILSRDPAKIYVNMNSKSRNYYLNQIKINSKKYKVSEIEYSLALIDLAENGESKLGKHIGYYLLDKGIYDYEEKYGKLSRKYEANIKFFKIAYLLLQISGTLSLFFLIFFVAQGSYLNKLIFAISCLIPSYLLTKKLLLRIAAKIDKDKKLPSLQIENNLDPSQATIFTIPAFIRNHHDIIRLTRSLETIYLGNRGDNIYFCLLIDFPDSHVEAESGEDALLNDFDNAIKELNIKYSFINKFGYFFRRRVWSDNQGLWMGWERKRGKVLEFLRALKGYNTNSRYILSFESIPECKYMVIVDEDSHVTKNIVLDLVSVIDHPLNRPEYCDKSDSIKRGYTIIRNISGYLYSTKEKTVFTRLMCGATGYSHYSNTVNEIYFKLFGESLFTGKGVLDIDIFLKLTNERFPDNTLLSHDLIEGMVCKVGFAGEGQVFEGFPTNVRSYLLRLHRWIRGDWQISNWLLDKVKDNRGVIRKNPLSFMDKIKIFESLITSLLIPNLFLLTLLVTFADFENRILLYLILLTEFFAYDYLTGLVELIWRLLGQFRLRFFVSDLISLNKFMLKDKLFEFLFLPYLAFLQIDAILKAIIRRFLTLKNTLEWTTFTAVEGHSARFAYLKLFFPTWLVLLIWFLLINLYNKVDPIIFCLILIWLISPFLVKVYDMRLKPKY